MKNILKYGAIAAIGIGLFFGKYLGRWIVNIIDNPDTRVNNGKPYVKQYLNNCDTLHLTMKNFTDTNSYFEVQGKFDLSKDDNTAYIDKYEITFYNPVVKKYFCAYYFFPMNSMNSQMYNIFTGDINQNGTNIIATVNKQELADPTYGTKEKPVPIVYYEVPEKMNSFYSLVDDEGKSNYSTEAEFKIYMTNYNIRNYLSYVKSQADFEKMFGKQPDK
ncbi:hypothetical protein [Pedobacter mendelii]|uniref:DUF8188 domain-containing protein n=1 Tax=Pedobacter mendelii TaxID=1908240 RepID=A0ABQ2BPL3_9SPHI|nr:hypothetical protein [Pedobacter mendelii]GGI29505.1 hypothetical protein GCM10008119_37960 [Pedobacter mendelii]